MAQVTIPNSMIVPVDYVHTGGATNSGLTLAKIVRGKGLFGRNEVLGQNQKMEGAKICMAVSQDDLDNLLLNVQQVSSADYNKVQALVNGEVDYFAGVHFIRSEQVPTADAGGGKVVKTLPMWLNKGVYLDFWYDVKTNIDVLPTVSQAIQVYSRLKAGAARKEEKYVALIMSENNAYTF